jgi:hypothetical protein
MNNRKIQRREILIKNEEKQNAKATPILVK